LRASRMTSPIGSATCTFTDPTRSVSVAGTGPTRHSPPGGAFTDPTRSVSVAGIPGMSAAATACSSFTDPTRSVSVAGPGGPSSTSASSCLHRPNAVGLRCGGVTAELPVPQWEGPSPTQRGRSPLRATAGGGEGVGACVLHRPNAVGLRCGYPGAGTGPRPDQSLHRPNAVGLRCGTRSPCVSAKHRGSFTDPTRSVSVAGKSCWRGRARTCAPSPTQRGRSPLRGGRRPTCATRRVAPSPTQRGRSPLRGLRQWVVRLDSQPFTDPTRSVSVAGPKARRSRR